MLGGLRITMGCADKQEQLLAWARYLYWADLACRQCNQFAEGDRKIDKWVDKWAFFARMSQFFAAEYVVIEGWREAGFTDSVIDGALNRWSDLLDLLRRYRNGVFHYQPKLVEPRLVGFLEESERSVFLVHYLHSEFCRYYWSYVDEFPGSSEQRSEWHENVLAIVGWVPDDLIEVMASSLRQIAHEADAKAQGDTSQQAQDLRDATVEARTIAHRQVMLYREMCRAFLARSMT
jgi:hypothetical protein